MTVAGFRGIATETEIDLDADVIVISGANGTGKTSVFDAILWGLTGNIDRIGAGSSVINRFAEYGDARVEIGLRGQGGREIQVVRRVSGIEEPSETLSVILDGQREDGATARSSLLSALYPEGSDSGEKLESFSHWLTNSVYLQQDRVNAFVDARNVQERFEIASELVGTAQLSKLNRELASARRAWTTETNKRRSRISELYQRLNTLKERLGSIDADVDAKETIVACERWLTSANEILKRSKAKVPSTNAGTATWASVIDRAIGRVSAELQSCDRLGSHIENARQSLQSVSDPTASIADARVAVELLERRVAQAAVELARAEEAASTARRQRIVQVEDSRSLANLAQLALRHLDGHCPVCNQQHDIQSTEQRLRTIIESADLPLDAPEESQVTITADNLRELETQVALERARLHSIESVHAQHNERIAQLHTAAETIGFIGPFNPDKLREAIESLDAQVVEHSYRLRTSREQGLRMSAALGRAGETSELPRLRQEIAELTSIIAEEESECDLRDQAYADALALHEAVRIREESFVEDELARVGELLQSIYAKVDPHPEFKAVQFLASRNRGSGRLRTRLLSAGTETPIVVDEPKSVLSSSQLNVLAVTIFMAMNLSVRDLPLEVMALDDPLQSLDDVNLLGLADLLRRLRGNRQLIVSTHDERLASLLETKLRPFESAERTLSISLRAWERSGPTLTEREIERADDGLRLVDG